MNTIPHYKLIAGDSPTQFCIKCNEASLEGYKPLFQPIVDTDHFIQQWVKTTKL